MYMAPNCAEFSFLYAVGYDTRMVCYWQWCISVLEYMGHARRDKEWSGVWRGPCACPSWGVEQASRQAQSLNIRSTPTIVPTHAYNLFRYEGWRATTIINSVISPLMSYNTPKVR